MIHDHAITEVIWDNHRAIFALLGALAIGAGAGVLGCFVVWRRLAYFGDSLGHSALLGAVLGLILDIGIFPGVIVVAAVFTLLLLGLESKGFFASDTVLGILSHGALAIGMLGAFALAIPESDIHAFLFGEINQIELIDLIGIYAVTVIGLGTSIICWPSLVLMTVDEDIARAEGVRVLAYRIGLMMMMAIFVAVSVRTVGLLLIASMLIIPASAGRLVADSVRSMAACSVLFGLIAASIGMASALLWSVPPGPTITVVAVILFCLAFVCRRRD